MTAEAEAGSHLTIERTSLGATDIRISPLGIGTWQWGDRMVWSYGQGGFSDDDLHAGFQAALTGGINFFDTAEVYGSGRSETLLGQFIRSAVQQPGQTASGIVVATKFMPYPWRLSRKELVSALRRSLKRLGLERVDLYQVHQPIPPLPPETWAAGLADAAGEGLVHAVGSRTTPKTGCAGLTTRSPSAASPWPPTRLNTASWCRTPNETAY